RWGIRWAVRSRCVSSLRDRWDIRSRCVSSLRDRWDIRSPVVLSGIRNPRMGAATITDIHRMAPDTETFS
ncbi:MAG TPA: hypothetical protein VHE54_18015, partial [Puia sp.]|nr:hypothetical protein [Puia sp.]